MTALRQAQDSALQETVNGSTTTFTMDLNTGLTQALSDGTNTYIYGVDRIAQVNTSTLITDYFMPDALSSVRQLTNTSGAITSTRAYDPYGVVTQAYGASQTDYGFTGEFTSNELVYLRARQYVPYLNHSPLLLGVVFVACARTRTRNKNGGGSWE